MSTIRLGVNIDHVATLRQARGTPYPDVPAAGRECLAVGADSITVHLREDRRHIQDADVRTLAETRGLILNLEMALTEEMLTIAETLRPAHCCLVPERREELTTEGGLDVAGQLPAMRTACHRLAQAGIQVSLFIDPERDQIASSAAAGAHAVELHTGAYADAETAEARTEELRRVRQAATKAASAGLEVHAGHGLHLDNVGAVAAISEIVELNIGHAIVARAVFVGLQRAVSEMRERMRSARGN